MADDIWYSFPDGYQPKFVDIMSGPNMPVATALHYLGWQVWAIDWTLCPQHDLNSSAFRNEVEQACAEADGIMIAMHCGSFSRARERPIPGHPNAPQPLRSREWPEGLPGLAPDVQQEVDKANALAKWT